MKNKLIVLVVLMAHSIQVLALDSFSYSGRLVNSNGSPVTGDVNLRFDLRSTEDSTDILCSKTINEVPLSQGIFNVKLDFLPVDCENNSIQSIMENIPSNHSLTYQVTDLTNSRTYSQQAIYSVPSSYMASFAKSLSSMGATITGQVLKWNAATSKWEAGTVGSGSGTITTINTGSGLSGGPIVNTGTISVAPGGITDGHLATGINPAKLSGTRDATKYLKGDNTWSSFQADLLATILNGFTSITGQTVSNSDSVLGAFGKLQGQVSTLTTNKLDKTGGTLIVGTIDGVPVPVLPSQIVNKQYVDDLVGGVNSSQWTTDAPHIYYNTGNVGIGTSTPGSPLTVKPTNTAATTTPGLWVDMWGIIPTTSNADANAFYSEISSQATQPVNSIINLNLDTGHTTSEDALNIYGIQNYVSNGGSGSHSDEIVGITSRARAHNFSDTDLLIGARISAEAEVNADLVEGVSVWSSNGAVTTDNRGVAILVTGAGTITNQSGLHVMMNGAGTKTNRYGIYLAAPGGTAATNDFGIYQVGTQKNYFNGNLGIGTTSPRSKLEVVGGMQIGADAATCDATKAGTLRYNATNVEYCNGTLWQAFGVSGAGITSLNGATTGTQTFASGTTGTAPAWSTAAGVHTLNIPFASAAGVTGGLLSKTDYDAFNAKLGTATALSGDVSGTYNATSVDKIKGTSVTITSLTSGNFLRYNGTNWVNTMLGATDVPNLDAAKITTGTLPIARGGTGATTADGALNNLLPTQTGNSGKVLSTNGTSTSWTSVTASPAGTDGQVQFNDSGSFGASANFSWDDTNSRLGIGTSTPSFSLSVGDGAAVDGSIIAKGYGVLGTDGHTLTESGAGTKLIWYPKKAAFRAGAVYGSKWDDANIGNYSVAFGEDNTASGVNSFVIGSNNTATGEGSFAMGMFSNATGVDSVAMGEGANASGMASIALGTSVTASAQRAVAIGESTTASGNRSTAMGYRTSSNAFYQFTVGKDNLPTGTENATTWVATDPLFVVGNGTGTGASRSNALMILKNGNVGIGTSSPRSKFEVVGGIQIGADAATCDATKVGTLRYNATNIEYCNGTSWQAFGVSGAGITSLNGATTGTQTFASGTTGTAPAWSTAAGVHTLNIPFASAAGVTGGLLSKTDYDAFNAKLGTATAFSGDVSGAYNATSVDKIKGKDIVPVAYAAKQVLRYDGTNWVNAQLSATTDLTGTLPVSNGGTGLSALTGNRIFRSNALGTAFESFTCSDTELLSFNALGEPVCSANAGTTAFVQNGNSFGANAVLGTNDNFPLYFETNGTTKMSVLANGNVGIGTTSPDAALTVNSSNTKTSLHLTAMGGGGYLSARGNTSQLDVFGGYEYDLAAGNYKARATSASGIEFNAGSVRIYTDASLTSGTAFTPSERMRIHPAGNVGIGATSPASRLSVNGNLSVGTYSTTAAPTNGMIVSGHVGIGTSTVERKLDITSIGNASYSDSSGANVSPAPNGNYPSMRVKSAMSGNSYGAFYELMVRNANAVYQSAYFGAISTGGVTEYSPSIVIGHQTGATSYNERLRIDSIGNVGIGTTAPEAKLEVAGQVKITGGTPGVGKVLTSDATGLASWVTPSGGGDFMADGSVTMTGSLKLPVGTAALPSLTFGSDLDTGFFNTTDGMGMSLAGAARFNYIYESTFGNGRFGINTVPNRALHVKQQTVSGVVATFEAPSGGAGIELKRTGNTSMYIRQDASGHLFIDDSFTETVAPSIFVSVSNGNVGIGTTTATYKLNVDGDINSTTALRIAGTQVCTSAGCTSSSDERLKKNISPLGNALENILKLQGVEYDYVDKTKFGDKRQIGVIAQSVEEVYPEVVVTDEESGFKSVAYDHLVAPLIEAVKSLYLIQTNQSRDIASKADGKDVEALKIENEELRKENEEIKARLRKIEETLKIN